MLGSELRVYSHDIGNPNIGTNFKEHMGSKTFDLLLTEISVAVRRVQFVYSVHLVSELNGRDRSYRVTQKVVGQNQRRYLLVVTEQFAT